MGSATERASIDHKSLGTPNISEKAIDKIYEEEEKRQKSTKVVFCMMQLPCYTVAESLKSKYNSISRLLGMQA